MSALWFEFRIFFAWQCSERAAMLEVEAVIASAAKGVRALMSAAPAVRGLASETQCRQGTKMQQVKKEMP